MVWTDLSFLGHFSISLVTFRLGGDTVLGLLCSCITWSGSREGYMLVLLLHKLFMKLITDFFHRWTWFFILATTFGSLFELLIKAITLS